RLCSCPGCCWGVCLYLFCLLYRLSPAKAPKRLRCMQFHKGTAERLITFRSKNTAPFEKNRTICVIKLTIQPPRLVGDACNLELPSPFARDFGACINWFLLLKLGSIESGTHAGNHQWGSDTYLVICNRPRERRGSRARPSSRGGSRYREGDPT
ncbi:hypothetical protein FN846DRAFT_973171, partial [Sphaerosporella brunnea]